MIDALKYFDGELKDIEAIPADLKAKYLTAFDVGFKWVIDAAARRQKWIDQSQSVNLWLKSPDLKVLSHMYRQAWHTGLKTTYYLRTLGASGIEKATVSTKKEVRATPANPAPPLRRNGRGRSRRRRWLNPPMSAPKTKKIYTAPKRLPARLRP